MTASTRRRPRTRTRPYSKQMPYQTLSEQLCHHRPTQILLEDHRTHRGIFQLTRNHTRTIRSRVQRSSRTQVSRARCQTTSTRTLSRITNTNRVHPIRWRDKSQIRRLRRRDWTMAQSPGRATCSIKQTSDSGSLRSTSVSRRPQRSLQALLCLISRSTRGKRDRDMSDRLLCRLRLKQIFRRKEFPSVFLFSHLLS